MDRPSGPQVAATGRTGTCLGITCLKWAADGELSDRDVQLVLQRLRRADAQAWAMGRQAG